MGSLLKAIRLFWVSEELGSYAGAVNLEITRLRCHGVMPKNAFVCKYDITSGEDTSGSRVDLEYSLPIIDPA